MTISDEYRQYAEECLRWASETKDMKRREQFLEMASAWVQAATLEEAKAPTERKADPLFASNH